MMRKLLQFYKDELHITQYLQVELNMLYKEFILTSVNLDITYKI